MDVLVVVDSVMNLYCLNDCQVPQTGAGPSSHFCFHRLLIIEMVMTVW